MSRGQIHLLKQILAAGEVTANLPLEKVRVNFERFVLRFPSVAGVVFEDVDAGGVPAQWIDARTNPQQPSAGTIFYLHGGGFVTGSVRSHAQLAARLSRAANARCLAVDYRLAPEHPFPAALDDALTAYRWLLERESAARVAVVGDSAGGGLGVLTLTRLRDAGEPLPAATVCLSPWVDYKGSDSVDRHAHLDLMVQRPGLEKMAAMYLVGADADDSQVSALTADLQGLPPMLIQAGEIEALVDDATRLASHARAAGVTVSLDLWPDVMHVWHLFAGRLEEGAEAISRAGQFLLQRWPKAAAATTANPSANLG